MRYHVTIRDNETREIHLDADTNMVIGACDEVTDITTFGHAEINEKKHAIILAALRDTIDCLLRENPAQKRIYRRTLRILRRESRKRRKP